MVFSSLLFTFFFLPIVLVSYYLTKNTLVRNVILLVASIVFYAYGEPKFVFLMLCSIVLNYFMALLINKNRNTKTAKLFMVIDVFFNIGLLFIFKYLDFSISIVNKVLHSHIQPYGIVLPIGISFFTFQALSYVIDVYRGRVKAQRNPLYVALYISFFPQLVAGPIVRYSTIEKEINDRACSVGLFAEGARRFMMGFCKKIIIANNLAVVVQKAFSLNATIANPLYLWLGSICFSLQIYYDFSGYSDMAIGLGKMFGFNFAENFNYPYIANSITDFWRRWHISLSEWFRDYVYIPLGGSRVSLPRQIFNLFVVWILTGIWHGANYTFIVWGLWYFVLLVVEKTIIKPERFSNKAQSFIWRIVTLLCINFGWVIFNSPDLTTGIQYCLAMTGHYSKVITTDPDIMYCFRQYGFFIFAGVVLSTPILSFLADKIERSKLKSFMTVTEPLIYAFLMLWAVSFLILGAHNPFIYFNF